MCVNFRWENFVSFFSWQCCVRYFIYYSENVFDNVLRVRMAWKMCLRSVRRLFNEQRKKSVWWRREVCLKLCFYCFTDLPRISIFRLKIMKIESISLWNDSFAVVLKSDCTNFYSSDLYPSSRASLCCLKRYISMKEDFHCLFENGFQFISLQSSILDYINKQESFFLS